MRYFLLGFAMILMIGASVHAQDDLLDTVNARFTIRDDSALIGEPFEITLIVEYPPSVEIVEWPEFDSEWTPSLEILSRTELEIQDISGDIQRQSQKFTVVSWQVGEFSTPETYIGFRRGADERVYRVSVRGASFRTPTTLEEKDLNQIILRPNKPPIEFFTISPLFAGSILVVIGAGGWFGGRWFVTIWKQRRLERERALAPTLLQVAIHELEGTRDLGDTPEAITRFDAILRDYIERRFALNATDMTSTELLTALRASNLFSGDLLDALMTILQCMDAIKYANVSVNGALVKQLHSALIQWLSATDGVEL